MRPQRRLVALSAVVLLGACGTGGGTTGSSTSGSTGGAPPSTPVSTTATTTTSTVPEDPTLPGRGKLVTVTGTVSAGVENGCLLLTTDPASPDGPWQLIGNIAGIEAGQQVTVRGARIDTVATTCQQGLPFAVQNVVPS